MTSKDIRTLLSSDAGKKELYTVHKKYFDLVDSWMTQFAEGDLLNEYQLADAMDKLTGCYGKCIIVGNAVDAYKINQELSFIEKAFKKTDKKPNVSQIKEEARASTSELRGIRGDFLNYAEASQKGIGTCQSRIKRLTIEKGAKKTDYVGEVPVEDAKPDTSADKEITEPVSEDIAWDE